MACFLFSYFATSILAFFGLERIHGRLTGRCGLCRYDLSGLDAAVRCPECGSADREKTAGASEIMVRGNALLAWSPTFPLVLFCVFEPELIRDAVDFPWRLRTGHWQALHLDTPVQLIYLAVVAAPLLARMRNRRHGLVAVLMLILISYLGCVIATFSA